MIMGDEERQWTMIMTVDMNNDNGITHENGWTWTWTLAHTYIHTDRQTDRQTDRRSREEDTGLQMLCNSPQLFNNYIIKHISSATKTHWPSFESDRKFGLPSYRIGHAFQSVGRHDFRTLGAGGHILWT